MRAGGVLMHITSLASPYGVGTMGKEAYEFVDFLVAARQTYWQVLPIGPTGYGDSPYSSYSTYAGNPYLIDFDKIKEDGYLRKADYDKINWGDNEEHVDFNILLENKFKVLRKAADRFLKKPADDYEKFLKKNKSWLEDYSLFMAIKSKQGGKSWQEWKKEYKLREKTAINLAKKKYKKEIDFWKVTQYFFYKQWYELKKYANKNGILIIGDIPIYVANDSCDVWSNPKEFKLDENLEPIWVAGCPPDGFSEDGQLWGNPTYDWDYMKKNNYKWWVKRIRYAKSLYDVVRIDHFRGFAGYYAIPYGDKNARGGHWEKGPGFNIFKAVFEKCGKDGIIAEDLGFLDKDVIALLKKTNFPGMKLLQFAFDTRDGGAYRPHSYIQNSVAYTGTHDNEPTMGWFKNAKKEDVKRTVTYFNLTKKEGYNWGMMRGVWSSVSDYAIVQAQDLLGLGNEARMNLPSTVGTHNWSWRAKPGVFTEELSEKLAYLMEIYGRCEIKD
ncbi:4-alpha-glucanotransferase [Eubacterium sp.]|uniref:4-alpha-glucanotransferase n=1 Tax=Eubacterium sp. TaxID=142586 RepID=UPI0025F82D94|nr:4-alpha-glucanotransferase [Eubacterium sp.]MCR5629737.1 4-alpha-glucanotransferase [Eubacterium sp.]